MPQQQVGAQLSLPAANQEAGGIEDQKGQHHPHKDGEHADELPDGLGRGSLGTAAQVLEHRLGFQGVEHIEQAHAEGDGEKPHSVVLHAAPHIFEGQLREHRSEHLPGGSHADDLLEKRRRLCPPRSSWVSTAPSCKKRMRRQ